MRAPPVISARRAISTPQRQLRTYASLISATVLETKCGYVAAEQVAIQPDGLRPEVGPLLEPSAYGASPQTR